MNIKTAALPLALFLPVAAWAADEVKIAADTSGLPAAMVQNIAHSSKSMGVKEPMNVSIKTENGTRYAVITGSSSTSCRVKLSNGNPPTMLGLSCR